MTQPDQVRDSTPPVKLGRNHGGYHGELIDIDAVLEDDRRAAREEQWHIETLGSDCMARLYASPERPGTALDGCTFPRASMETSRRGRWPSANCCWRTDGRPT